MYRNGVPPPREGPEKRKIEKTKKTYTLNAIKRLENTDEKNTAVERCTVEVREK